METFTEQKIKDIDFHKFSHIFTDDIKRLISIVRKYGFEIRVVGGAVRDFLINKEPRDVDFATDADPTELIFILDLEGIKYDTSGIRHGTVKAHFGNIKVDISSLDYILAVKNKRIETYQTHSWKSDALRRDLTVNSMSVDMDGHLYDYSTGLKDLRRKLVRFQPNATEKLKQEPLVLLRWFRGLGYFTDSKFLKKDFDLIKKNIEILENLKDDPRVDKVMADILKAPNATRIFKLMCLAGVNKYFKIPC